MWLPLCRAEQVCLAFLEGGRGQAHCQALPEPSPVDQQYRDDNQINNCADKLISVVIITT